jgi:hypothetical protein
MIIRKNPEKNRNPEKSGTRKKPGKTCKIRNFSGKSGRSGNTARYIQFAAVANQFAPFTLLLQTAYLIIAFYIPIQYLCDFCDHSNGSS